MKKLSALLSVLLMVGVPGVAQALSMPSLERPVERSIHLVADNCYAVGQRLAQERGAKLLRADAVGSGECRVVMLVPDGEGGRPRREEIVVPMR
ncbi:hypothetical protein [Notoacmeibacter marinus]|uniref:hypothetical protein n=1 Tax=Notoacmeibacter marinus TaxID=1876515 RepID=UPI000DF347E7|nr:hypothetical protein [Notoacmeibacter marinus]